MKRRERNLLNHFSKDDPINVGLLSSIKNSMGSVGYVQGNPLSKTEVSISVSKNYFADGVSILPTALPIALQTPLPVFLFGLTDYYSGYAKGLSIMKPFNPWTCINGQGEIIGDELIDQSQLTGWVQPAWWTVFGADWSQQAGGLGQFILRCNGAGIAPGLISIPIFRTGHKYRLSAKIVNTAYSVVNGIQIGDVFGIADPDNLLNHDYDFWLRDFISQPNPVNPPLRIVSDFFACDLIQLSAKEIIGYENFKGEPAIGIFGFTKNFVFSTNVERGDLVITYAANPYPSGITYTCEIIIHCDNIAYGTFLNSFVSDLITIDTLRYIVPIASITQFINPINFMYQTIFGKYNDNGVDPRNYIVNTDFQQQICDIPITLPIDKNLLLSVPMNFDCNSFDMVMFVNKVDALTHNLKY